MTRTRVAQNWADCSGAIADVCATKPTLGAFLKCDGYDTDAQSGDVDARHGGCHGGGVRVGDGARVYLDECMIEYNDAEGGVISGGVVVDGDGASPDQRPPGEGGGIFMIGRGDSEDTVAGTAFLSIRSSTFTGNRASRVKGWGLRLYTSKEACVAI